LQCLKGGWKGTRVLGWAEGRIFVEKKESRGNKPQRWGDLTSVRGRGEKVKQKKVGLLRTDNPPKQKSKMGGSGKNH